MPTEKADKSRRKGLERQLDLRHEQLTTPQIEGATTQAEGHAALTGAAHDVFGNQVVTASLAGALDGPGELIEGALTLGAAGIDVGMDTLLGNSAVNGWMSEYGAGEVDAGGPAAAIERHAAWGGGGPSAASKVNRAMSRGGRSLPAGVRAEMEARFGGVDFGGVRIHTDAAAASAAEAISAHAFALGPDIYFGEGEFNPSSRDGMHLLAHELTHVVQGGLAPMAKEKVGGVSVSSPTDSAEKEAEEVARQVVAGTSAAVSRGSGAVRRLVSRAAGPSRSVSRLSRRGETGAVAERMAQRFGSTGQGETPAGKRPRMDMATHGRLGDIAGFDRLLEEGGHDGHVDLDLGQVGKGAVEVEKDPEGNLIGGSGVLEVDHPLLGAVNPIVDLRVDDQGQVRGAGLVQGADLQLGGLPVDGAIELFVGADQKLGARGELTVDLGPGYAARLVPDPREDGLGLIGDVALLPGAAAVTEERWRLTTAGGLGLRVEGTVSAEIDGQPAMLSATLEGGRLRVRGTVDGPTGPRDIELDEHGVVV